MQPPKKAISLKQQLKDIELIQAKSDPEKYDMLSIRLSSSEDEAEYLTISLDSHLVMGQFNQLLKKAHERTERQIEKGNE